MGRVVVRYKRRRRGRIRGRETCRERRKSSSMQEEAFLHLNEFFRVRFRLSITTLTGLGVGTKGGMG